MYLMGFGNHHSTEAIPGALPTTQNSPQKCAFGLYAEQLSGSAFSRQRHNNLHSWLYRIRPSPMQPDYTPYHASIISNFTPKLAPNPMRWSPRPNLQINQDFWME